MIILNGKRFAETEDEMIESLFQSGGTCVGYAKKLSRHVKLMDHQKQLVGVINKYGVLVKATKQADGKYWYSYGDIELLGDYRYKNQIEEVEALPVRHSWERNERVYWFK